MHRYLGNSIAFKAYSQLEANSSTSRNTKKILELKAIV